MTSAIMIGMLTTLLAGGMIAMPQGGLKDPGPSFPTQSDIEAVRTFLSSRADVASFEIETENELGNEDGAEREFEVKVETTSGEEKVLKFEREVEDNGQIELKVVSENDGQRVELDNDNDRNRRGGENENSDDNSGRDRDNDDESDSRGSNSGPSGDIADDGNNEDNSGPGNAGERHSLRDDNRQSGRMESEIEVADDDSGRQ